MGKPKTEVNDKEYYKDIHFLYDILNKLKNIDEIKVFFKDILTPSELRMLKRRWHIACLLDEGWDLRKAAVRSQTSSSTVVKVKKLIAEGRGGLKLALERTRSKRRQKVPYEKSSPLSSIKNYSHWVFGRSKEA